MVTMLTPYGPMYQKVFSNIADGTQPVSTGNGTAITADAAANTKGLWTELINGTNLTDNCYIIEVYITSGGSNANSRHDLLDIGIDPSNGGSYTTYIPNLLIGCAGIYAPNAADGTGGGGHHYWFPLFFKAGTQIGARIQANVAGGHVVQVQVILHGCPKYPHLARAGSFVTAFGPNTTNTQGVNLTASVGTASDGTWVDLSGSNTTTELWFWQLGVLCTDASMTDELYYHCDLGVGDASNKQVVINNQRVSHTSNERQTKYCQPFEGHYEVPAGVRPYARAQASGASDNAFMAAAYGVGGNAGAMFTPFGPMYQKVISNIVADEQPAQGGNGSSSTADPSANTKGAWGELLNGTAVTDDCYAIEIYISSGASNASVRAYCVDIGVDPSNGGSYSVYIPNLLIGPVGIYRPGLTNATGGGGAHFFFPLFFKAGTQIATRFSSAVGGTGPGSVEIRLWACPKYPHLARAGTFVREFCSGAPGDAVGGVAVAPGTGSEGSWVDVHGADTADKLWWWQFGVSVGDSTMINNYYHYDLGIGDASNKHVVIHNQRFNDTANERQTKYAHPIQGHYEAPAGVRSYMRGQSSGTGNANLQARVYGVGG